MDHRDQLGAKAFDGLLTGKDLEHTDVVEPHAR